MSNKKSKSAGEANEGFPGGGLSFLRSGTPATQVFGAQNLSRVRKPESTTFAEKWPKSPQNAKHSPKIGRGPAQNWPRSAKMANFAEIWSNSFPTNRFSAEMWIGTQKFSRGYNPSFDPATCQSAASRSARIQFRPHSKPLSHRRKQILGRLN